MALYDPIKTRTRAFSEHLRKYHLEKQYLPEMPMGNCGISDIGRVVKAWLVGYHEEMAPLLPRALKWIDMALARDERFGVVHASYRTDLYWATALGSWMLDGMIAEDSWKAAQRFQEAWWRDEKYPWTMHEVIHEGLDDYLAFCFSGGGEPEDFAVGVEMYERWTGKRDVRLSGTLKPREFALALCLHFGGLKAFDEDDLYQAGRRMLRANLQDAWLGSGQYIRAATWLYIVHGFRDISGTLETPPLTPRQIILKAYEDMPKVPKPDFVPEA